MQINTSADCNRSDSQNPFCKKNVDVSNFLNLNSLSNHNLYCLAYVFTYRDFSQGTLGLAWVGSSLSKLHYHHRHHKTFAVVQTQFSLLLYFKICMKASTIIWLSTIILLSVYGTGQPASVWDQSHFAQEFGGTQREDGDLWPKSLVIHEDSMRFFTQESGDRWRENGVNQSIKCHIITAYILLHFRNTSDENVISERICESLAFCDAEVE